MSAPDGVAATQRRTWTGGTRGGGAGNRFFAWMAGCGLGRAVAPVLIVLVAAYFVVVAGAGRRASFALAERIGQGGGALRRLWFAFRHFFTFGTLLFDRTAYLGGGEAGFTFETDGYERIDAAAAAGRGVIVVTAHFGNWELMGQRLAAPGRAVTLVMHDGLPEAARAALADLTRKRSFTVLFTDGSPGAAAAILAALRRGDVVGMMGDRLLGGRGVALPFLGARAEFPLGPYVLAQAAEAPLLHVFSERVGRRRYRFSAHAEDADDVAAPGSLRANAAGRAAAFAARLEAFVRRSPLQWGNFYPFWREA